MGEELRHVLSAADPISEVGEGGGWGRQRMRAQLPTQL